MIELLVLVAIAYAGARGVESIASTTDRRHDSPAARKTIEKIAAGGPKDAKSKEPPGPTDPGGTFSAAAPRSAKLGGKVAVPVAVVAETGSTMWRAIGEGYRERWPEIREERRQKMADKAAKKQAAKAEAEAKRQAAEAREKAGPPPPYPPTPADPPNPAGLPQSADGAGRRADSPPAGDQQGWVLDDGEEDPPVPGPRTPAEARADAAEARVEAAEKKAEDARKEAEDARAAEATAKVLAAQKAEREAKEREAAAEQRARAAEERAAEERAAAERAAAERAAADRATPDKPKPEPEPEAGRRHLMVVPDPAQNGDPMSAPATLIPEIRTLDGLMNALAITRAMCEMRAEEAQAVADDDRRLSDLLDRVEAQMAELEVDDKTRQEVGLLRELISLQSTTARTYSQAALDTGAFATAAAGAAYKSHGGIAEAVQSSPIELAAQAGYYES
ncbi:hypothetical protein AB4225_29235 [Streptomyces sp. 2RAF24]|uniref:hypothetical protein n=1 Tax=Streptomyces sp. 2RAF24 TaxID=3232997 RepID=UPI003F977BC3